MKKRSNIQSRMIKPHYFVHYKEEKKKQNKNTTKPKKYTEKYIKKFIHTMKERINQYYSEQEH